MKYLGTITAAFLFFFCTIAAPAYAQDQREEAKPPQQQEEPKPKEEPKSKESKPQESKPDNRTQDQQVKEQKDQAKEQEKHQQDETKHEQEDQSKQQQKNEEQQQKQAQQDQKRKDDDAKHAQKDQDKQQKDQNRQQARASSPSDQNDHNHGQHSNQRIPDEKFHASFGREHHFHVGHPVIVESRPRFQYSGYWFEFVDAWPADWSYDDDCYIDYVDDGYYLFDPIHPGMRIALTVIF